MLRHFWLGKGCLGRGRAEQQKNSTGQSIGCYQQHHSFSVDITCTAVNSFVVQVDTFTNYLARLQRTIQTLIPLASPYPCAKHIKGPLDTSIL